MTRARGGQQGHREDNKGTERITRMQGGRQGRREDAGDSDNEGELRRGEGTSLRERRGQKGTLIH